MGKNLVDARKIKPKSIEEKPRRSKTDHTEEPWKDSVGDSEAGSAQRKAGAVGYEECIEQGDLFEKLFIK